MGRLLGTSLLPTLTATLASANSACISAVTWGDPRVDLFGRSPDHSLWHKFSTGYDWQPEGVEHIPSDAFSCPSVSSWGYGRLDIVWINRSDGIVLHKYFDGGNWGPSWEGAIELSGDGDLDSVETLSWGQGRLDIIGNAPNGSILHKAWTGTDYYPTGKEWEDLGGNFSGLPSIGSWGENRLDVVGISAETGSLFHRFWEGTKWSDWEDLEGGPFIGKPTVSSWGPERLDLWAIDQGGVVHHKFWDGSQWNGWEKLGGKFTQTPQVAHWTKGKIDIVGRGLDDNKFYLKSFDGDNWNPDVKGFYDLSGPYDSEPRLLTKLNNQNFLYLFGVDQDSILRMQIWSGFDWQPGPQKTWPLGNVSSTMASGGSGDLAFGTQHVLLGAEL
ncbi:hypothetical protein NUW58_g5228 [Xylaria curta]|uniref:Uncharacterized protein n=1 Tax=Xylaria curta TaxID=42375 RepID=A0ACC1P3S5_9PEZI|nr:hypothetical protein NUW58_g5228 [Xylaria curta]